MGRFVDPDLRMRIWANKGYAEKNKVFMEEWLTDYRAKLMKQCKNLLKEEYIENVKTKEGDIIVLYKDNISGQIAKKTILSQEDYDQLLILVGKTSENKIEPDKLDGSPVQEQV